MEQAVLSSAQGFQQYEATGWAHFLCHISLVSFIIYLKDNFEPRNLLQANEIALVSTKKYDSGTLLISSILRGHGTRRRRRRRILCRRNKCAYNVLASQKPILKFSKLIYKGSEKSSCHDILTESAHILLLMTGYF